MYSKFDRIIFVCFLVLLVVAFVGFLNLSQAHATIYVSTEEPVISTFPDDTNGDIVPTTTITNPSALLSDPYGLDVHDGFIYAGNNSSSRGITVYPVTADGNVAPVRQITGTGVRGLAVDATGIYATSSNRIVFFPLSANGNVAPSRVISGAATTLVSPQKIDIDSSFIYVTDVSTEDRILVFPKFAEDNVAPLRTISGGNTNLNDNYAIAVDESFIYTANYGGPPPYSILVFPIGADDNVAPVRTISGGNTTLNQPYGLDVDSGFIYVANYNNASVDVWPSDAFGDVAPLRTIAGGNTSLDGYPVGIAVDTQQIIPVVDSILFPWVVRSDDVTTVISVVNTAQTWAEAVGLPFHNNRIHVEYWHKLSTANDQEEKCREYNFEVTSSKDDMVTWDMAGHFNNGLPMFNDTSNEVIGVPDMTLAVENPRRAFLIVDNYTDALIDAGTNVDGTMYGEATIIEHRTGAAWGYIGYNAVGRYEDFSDASH